jgi:hypothetical protein
MPATTMLPRASVHGAPPHMRWGRRIIGNSATLLRGNFSVAPVDASSRRAYHADDRHTPRVGGPRAWATSGRHATTGCHSRACCSRPDRSRPKSARQQGSHGRPRRRRCLHGDLTGRVRRRASTAPAIRPAGPLIRPPDERRPSLDFLTWLR